MKRKWKDSQHHMSLGNGNLKQHQYHYTPTEWPETETFTPSSVGKDMDHQELSLIVDGNAVWFSHFRRQLCNIL